MSSKAEAEAIAGARVFVVGAGGIGCELLKTLVLSGFRTLDVVDLDTVDVSNLNRQFLFRRAHVGRPKAAVAAAAASAIAGDGVRITAHHASVKSADFGAQFVARFSLVVNALDNLDARRHVNRLCLAAGVPLLESATEGYMGSVTPILRGATECYECQPQPAPKAFATCTIRSNPTEPVHCVTWAKYLFARLWGVQDHVNAVADFASPAERASARAVFDRVFADDVAALAAMERLWVGRRPPAPLTFAEALLRTTASSSSSSASAAAALADQRLWSIAECAQAFEASFAAMDAAARANGGAPLEWDKDVPAALDFVTAAANVRAAVFGIAQTSRFDVKAMAGSIVPAIATSNAIIAGVLVAEAVKIVTGRSAECRGVHLTTNPDRLFVVRTLEPPNPSCYVCGHHYITVRTHVASVTLGSFVNALLRKALGFNDPSVLVGNDIVYECGEGLEEDEVEHFARMAARPLAEVHVVDGASVEVRDFSQDLSVTLTVFDAPAKPADSSEDELFEVTSGTAPKPAAERFPHQQVAPSTIPKEQQQQQMEVSADEDDEPEVIALHAPRTQPQTQAQAASAAASASEVVVLDDDDDN